VDGGSMFAQRRNAQNAADAMSMGAARDMLTIFNANSGAMARWPTNRP